jgi:hypothetical protein
LRKYLETTMSVASCDQPVGTSAPSILKTTEPSGFVMTLERRSQVTCSSGSFERSVYLRSNARPPRCRARPAAGAEARALAPLLGGEAAAPPRLAAAFFAFTRSIPEPAR